MTGARWKLPLMWSPDHRTKWVASTHPPAVRSDIRERGGANVRKANLKLPHERQQLKVRNGRTPVSLCESTSGRCTLKADVDVALGRRAAMGVRREKVALSSGCKSHPATAPAGSNRSSYGGNEVAEPFGKRVKIYGTRARGRAESECN